MNCDLVRLIFFFLFNSETVCCKVPLSSRLHQLILETRRGEPSQVAANVVLRVLSLSNLTSNGPVSPSSRGVDRRLVDGSTVCRTAGPCSALHSAADLCTPPRLPPPSLQTGTTPDVSPQPVAHSLSVCSLVSATFRLRVIFSF